MIKKVDFKRHGYWVLVDPSVNAETGEVTYVAYVNDNEPTALFYGTSVKNPDGSVAHFTTELAALTNANAVKQSEIGNR